MKNIEPHFSATQLAGLPGMPGTERGVRKMAVREAWPKIKRSAGKGWEYPLSALPAETQAALALKLLDRSSLAPFLPGGEAAGSFTPKSRCEKQPITDAQLATLAAVYEAKPQKEKDEAARRLMLLRDWHALLAHGLARQAVIETLTAKYEVSKATLSRYLSLVRGQPEHAWLYLLTPRYCGRIAHAQMSAEAWEWLKADYLRPERPSASACIWRLRRIAAERGWTIPSDRTLMRRLERLPRAVKVLARHGKMAAQQLYPPQVRDKQALHALSIINGDGYKHNLWVVFPDGEIVRAKTWYWQDVYSNAILAFRVDKTEHTDVIRLSFGDVVERYGIPDEVVIDNTMAAANKTMTGGLRNRFRFRVKDEEPLGIFPLLNVNARWATPGHGQAKPVERAFGIGGIGEIIDRAPEFAGAWTGASTQDKPEYDGKTRAVKLEQLVAVIEREVDAWNRKPGRRSAVARGRSYWEVFEESFKASAIRRATEAQRRLWLLATEPVRANSRDGSITLDAGRVVGERQANRYWCPELTEYAGQSVVARFDPARLHEGVHVYTLDGRYIGYAHCHAPAGFNDAAAAREHTRARKAFLRAQKVLLDAEVRMDVLEAAKLLSGTPGASVAPVVIRPGVVRAEFRDPLERPAPTPTLSAEQQAELERLAAEFEITAACESQVIESLQSDVERYEYWRRLKARLDAGEQLTGSEEAFFRAFGESAYCRMALEAEAEFGATLARRAAS